MIRLSIIFTALLLGACTATIQGNATLETDATAAIPRIVGDNWTAEDLRIENPEAATVIIYSHGTRRSWYYDDCELPGYRPPPILTKLDGGDVYLVRHCSLAVEEATQSDAGNQVYRKAAEITRLAEGYAANGVNPSRIFLTGNSNGGWSSLIAFTRSPDSFGGVVAFAPAFAGRRSERWVLPWWGNEVRPRQVRELSEAARLRALVYAYPGDPFNRPQDLAFLPEAHPDTIELVSYSCGLANPHGTYRRDCREAETRAAILAFIADRSS